jgi:multidrug efflux pump subunit AcrA (membrane-fusion protein)
MAKVVDVQAAQANVARLEAMTSFKNLTAPFDGIVTARSLDIGDLVDAGERPARPCSWCPISMPCASCQCPSGISPRHEGGA